MKMLVLKFYICNTLPYSVGVEFATPKFDGEYSIGINLFSKSLVISAKIVKP